MDELNKEIFKSGIIKLKDFYPNWQIDISNARTMKAWYQQFKNMRKDAFEKMVENHIKNERYSPSVKSLRDNSVRKDDYYSS